MKIYTKTGDKGKTSLFDGTRVAKDNIRVDTYGTVDELNSLFGIIVAEIKNAKIKKELIHMQQDLFTIGAKLANPSEVPTDTFNNTLEKRITSFEKFIDEMTAKLPELTNFILPGGGIAGASLQFARTVCRRVERRIVTLSLQEKVEPVIIRYFNRLSDLLFTMSRYVNFKEEKKEVVWTNN